MLRKLILLAILLLIPSLSKAQAVVDLSTAFSKLTMHEAVGFDIGSKNVTDYTAADIIVGTGFLTNFTISGGYSTSSAIVASVDYDLGGLTKLGLNVPIINLVDLRVGFMVGVSDLSFATTSGTAERNKLVYGPEVTIVSVKF